VFLRIHTTEPVTSTHRISAEKFVLAGHQNQHARRARYPASCAPHLGIERWTLSVGRWTFAW
jgi:hypothetical protein